MPINCLSAIPSASGGLHPPKVICLVAGVSFDGFRMLPGSLNAWTAYDAGLVLEMIGATEATQAA